MEDCLGQPSAVPTPIRPGLTVTLYRTALDHDYDLDVDIEDWVEFQREFDNDG